MLKLLRRMRRTQKYIIIFFAALLGISLVLFYAPTRNTADAAAIAATEQIAEVGDETITAGDLTRATEQLQQQFGGQISIATLGGPRRLLDGLIESKVAAREARERDLEVSDAEINNEVHRQFVNKGQFVGIKRYREIATSQYGSPEQFEARLRQDLAGEKLRSFITAGVRISDQEVQDDYQRKNTKFNLVYVPITVENVAARLQPSDAEIQAYFDSNKESFRINEPQKKVAYLFVETAKAGSKLDIPEADLRATYDRLSDDKKQAGVRVQQIVLKVARPDLDDAVRQKAEGIAAELRQKANDSGVVSPEAFAEVARGQSEDPTSAKAGGTLAAVVRQDQSKASDPLQQVFTLEAGEITQPAKSGNAYYIFRRGEGVPQSFEQKRQELLVSARNSRGYAAAQAIAGRAAELLRETKDIRRVAEQLAPQANMTPAEMVKETGFIKPGDDVPNIGVNQDFEGVIAPLNNPGDIGDRIGIKNGIAVPQLMEKRDPRIPEVAEVREQVVARVRDEAARNRIEQVARELAAGSASPADLRQRAAALGLTPQTSDDYTLGSPLETIGASPAADAAIFNLSENAVTREPIKVSDNYVVIAAAKRTDADLTEFAKQRDTLTQSALAERQTQVFADFVAAARRRMEQDGEIKINNEAVDKIAAQIEADQPAMTPGGFPGGLPPGLTLPPNG